MKFSGKVAMITGAGVGIGRAVALCMAEEGADLVLLDIQSQTLEELKKELSRFPVRVFTAVCDVADQAAVDAAVADAAAALGKIDILVNNAALWRSYVPFGEETAELWQKFMNINVMGVYYCTHAVLDGMLQRGFGRIINVASIAGVYGNANMVCYSATKGAVIAMTRALAKEVSAKGVLVNAVSPGSVSDSSDRDIDAFQPSELAFMGRTGTDRENAALICFLASEEASYISGQNIQIDGCRKRM